jgi:transcriptional regulator with XRE-family HTH domain
MNIIRQKMKDKKITQIELAELTGIPQPSISYLLRQLDKQVIKIANFERLQKICEVLKIKPEKVLRSKK